MSLLLVLNAAEARVQAVFAEEEPDRPAGRLLAAEDWYAPSHGTELLPPLVHDALQRLGRTPADVGRVACVTGPGSFTGIRLVLTLAAAMRRVLDMPCAGINYLQALAASLPCASGCHIRVLTTARRDKVHAQTFIMAANGLPVPHPATPEPQLLPLAAAAWTAPVDTVESASSVCYIGSGAHLVPLPEGAAVHTELNTPTPTALVRLADAATDWAKRDLDPLYVRPCDAIDNLNHIAELRGQHPDEAQAELARLLREGVPLR